MAGIYLPQSWYFDRARNMLQDEIEPYRYTDDVLGYCFNYCLREITRLRPDMLMDLKYQAPLMKGDLGTGSENFTFLNSYPTADQDTLAPIPAMYQQAILWGATAVAQFMDVTDTQDQRAQAFLSKFGTHLMTLSGV